MNAEQEQVEAFLYVVRCLPDGAADYVAALERRRTRDIGPRDRWIYQPLLVDPLLLDMALRHAQDAGASLTARALSLQILGTLVDGARTNLYEVLTYATPGEGCQFDPTPTPRPMARALPADTRQRIWQAAQPMERDAQLPQSLRSAANCVMNELRRVSGLPRQDLLEGHGYAFQVVHECGDRYALWVTTEYMIRLQYAVDRWPQRKTLYPTPRTPANPSPRTVITGDAVRPLTVYLDGEPRTVAPSRGPCP